MSAFSPHPSPANPTFLSHLYPTPLFCPCVLYSSSCRPLSPLSPPHSPLANVTLFFKIFNKRLFQLPCLPVLPSLLSLISSYAQIFLPSKLLLFLLLNMSGDFSGWWTWWILCYWVCGLCCLPLKRFGYCSEEQLSSLWIIWSLVACFWDLLAKLLSDLHFWDSSAWIFRLNYDTSEVPPSAQCSLRTHHSCQSSNISCPVSALGTVQLRTFHWVFAWLCGLSFYVSKALYTSKT